MGYSNTRLLIIALAWVVVTLLFVGVPVPEFDTGIGVGAQDDRGCAPGGPCKFPAESNVGGIVLGTNKIDFSNIRIWDQTQNLAPAALPPNRVDSTESVIGLGVNDVTVDSFLVYKSWRFDEPPYSGRQDVYTYVQTNEAVVSGTPECGNDNTDDGGVNGIGNATAAREQCDLFAEAGELSADSISATANIDGALLDAAGQGLRVLEECGGPLFPPDLQCNFDVDADNYWVVNPNEDTSCSSGLINLLQDVLADENLCLQIVKSGGIIDADKAIPGAQATINGQAQDFLIRAHNIEASGDVGQNKELSLKDAYLEIRYGKGQDRAATPFSNLGTTWGDPINNDTVVRSAGITNPFNCQGNRELGNPSCNIDSDRKTINNESYNNIHG